MCVLARVYIAEECVLIALAKARRILGYQLTYSSNCRMSYTFHKCPAPSELIR